MPAREFARALRENARQHARAVAAAREAAEVTAAAAEAAAARQAEQRDAAANRTSGSGGGFGTGSRDPNADLRDAIRDLSLRAVGGAARYSRIAAAQGVEAISRALALGERDQPTAEDIAAARARSALQMRGISQGDFETALQNVRPTGK